MSNLQAAVGLLRHATGDERLGIDDLPVLEARRRVGVADLFDEGTAIDRRKQPRTLEVGCDHVRDLLAELTLQEVGDGNRQRLDIALVKGELDQCICR
ncbi:hypothetical protein D9M70_626900 [compost metagenome]